MKWLIVSLALVATVQEALASNSSLRVTWGKGDSDDYGEKYYKYIPRTTSEAVESGWDAVTLSYEPHIESVMYCYEDRQICGYYDQDTGFIIGMQSALPKENITNSIYDFGVQGFRNWIAEVNGVSKEFWANEMWFAPETYMEKSLEERQAIADAKVTLQEKAAWVRGINGVILRIPTNISEIVNDGYVKQGCYSMMGRHYYYNMTENTECSATTMYPYVAIANGDEFIGFSFVIFVTLSSQEGGRGWYEVPTASAAKAIVPYGPECLTELVDNIGVITLHTYFIEEPWNISCDSA